MSTAEKSGSGGVSGTCGDVADGHVNASSSSVDGLKQPVSMVTKKANIQRLVAKFGGRWVAVPLLSAHLKTCQLFLVVLSDSRTITKDSLDLLGLRDKDRLTFVSQIVYNSSPVTLVRKSTNDGSFLASCVKMLKVFAKVSE